MSSLPDRLVEAIATRTAIAPHADDLTVAEAYELQDQTLDLLGAPRVAAKLGLTSRAKQEQMSVDEPLYGWMLEGMQIDVGEPLVVSALIQPRVEPEIAFFTNKDLSGPAVSSAHVLAATESVMPAIDVLDSRYSGYQFTLPAVIADNASGARFMVGDPVSPAGIDLRLVGCVLEKNGELVATVSGAAILEHPAAALAWFVRRLAQRDMNLPAGSLVLAGSLTAAIPVTAGDVVRTTIDRIGSIELRCVG